MEYSSALIAVHSVNPSTGANLSATPDAVHNGVSPDAAAAAAAPAAVPAPKRPGRGERKPQILQMLALMLEDPRAERVTTAALAAKLSISEAALYRHFSGKAKMFEALIEFIEEAVLGLMRQIHQRAEPGHVQAMRIVVAILQFAEKNPGMARVMAGDALVLEHPDLQVRMARLYDKVESSLKQCLRVAAAQQPTERGASQAQQRAHMAVALILGKIHRYARSEFQILPTVHIDAHVLAQIFTQQAIS